MSISLKKFSLLAATSLGAAVTPPALAQDASATGDIVVTARRVEERLQDVPISITVYNQEQLANRNIVNPADLATYTPSLTVNQRYGPEKSSFVIRGFTQETNTSPSVGTYFADVVAPRAQAGTASGNGAGAGSLFDLQNVQVLKGPQGTLFGRNTTGGAVLLVPNKPTDRLEGYVEGQLGDYDLQRVQAVLNVPLSDTFKVRLGFDRNKRDGYMRNHSGTGPRGYNDVNYFAFRASVVADLTPDLENYTIFSYNNSFSNGYGARLTNCVYDGIVPGFQLSSGQRRTAGAACDQIARQDARGDGPLDVEISNPDPFLKIRQWQVINTTTWKASDTLTIKNIVSYAEFREAASFSLNGDNFFYPDPAPPGVPASFIGRPFWYIQLQPGPGEDNAAQSTMTEELQFQGTSADGSLVWQAGAYLEVSKPLGWSTGWTPQFMYCSDLQALECENPLGIGNINESPYKTSWNNKGLYAQATYNFTDKLSLTGGIRYTWDKVKSIGEANRIRIPPPSGGPLVAVCNDPRIPGNALNNRQICHREYSQKSNRPTWLINLDYKPIPDVMVYAKYARGYRQGGVNLTNIGLESWGPEKVEAYEIGAKTSFRGNSLQGYFNVAGFYNDFSDQQIIGNLTAKPESGLAGGNAVINAGKSRIWGIEVDSSVTLFDQLRLDLGYTYLNTKLQEIIIPELPPESPFSEIRPTALLGETLALSPKHRLTASATYTLPLDESIGRISIGATYVYTAKQWASHSSDYLTLTNGQRIRTASVFGYEPGLLPATNLVNLNIGWNNVMGGPVDAAFFLTNLTDEIYPVNIGSSLTSGGFENALYGAPRMWGFRLRYSFGKD